MPYKIIDIELFEILDRIAQRHNVTDTAWARSASTQGRVFHRPRINELRVLAKAIRSGEDGATVGRAFPIEKADRLIQGLRLEIGGNTVTKELAEALETTASPKIKNMILVNMLSDSNQETLSIFIQSLLKNDEKSSTIKD